MVDVVACEGGEEGVGTREDPGYEPESRPAVKRQQDEAEEESAGRP